MATVPKGPRIGEVMTPLPRSVDTDTPVRAARELMRQRGIRHLPVRSGDSVVALLSDRDLKRSLDPDLGLPGVDELFVGDVAVFEIHTVSEDTHLATVARTMWDLHVGSIVVERDGDLVGIFTSSDACRILSEFLHDPQNAPADAS